MQSTPRKQGLGLQWERCSWKPAGKAQSEPPRGQHANPRGGKHSDSTGSPPLHSHSPHTWHSMMVFRIRDISFTWQTRGWGRVSSQHLPPHPRARSPLLTGSNLVSDIIPQLHQDLVEEGELGDQCLGLLPCQGPGCREAQNCDSSPGPSLGNKPAPAPAPPLPPTFKFLPTPELKRTQSQAAAKAWPSSTHSCPSTSSRPTHLGWSEGRWPLERRKHN